MAWVREPSAQQQNPTWIGDLPMPGRVRHVLPFSSRGAGPTGAIGVGRGPACLCSLDARSTSVSAGRLRPRPGAAVLLCSRGLLARLEVARPGHRNRTQPGRPYRLGALGKIRARPRTSLSRSQIKRPSAGSRAEGRRTDHNSTNLNPDENGGTATGPAGPGRSRQVWPVQGQPQRPMWGQCGTRQWHTPRHRCMHPRSEV